MNGKKMMMISMVNKYRYILRGKDDPIGVSIMKRADQIVAERQGWTRKKALIHLAANHVRQEYRDAAEQLLEEELLLKEDKTEEGG